MTHSKKALMAGAALAGLLAGSAAVQAANLPAKTQPLRNVRNRSGSRPELACECSSR